ncbi:hypothetical protein GCM10009530_34910 [Microbispora corallina]|uniref:Uncharacterized protein n=1 Tax=Microbispora corallina TaxID=83302 RepID=A0ABQ4FYS7_9ACTN|nr:hypothetical protein Mco01_29730 [Microbispora corallina]
MQVVAQPIPGLYRCALSCRSAMHVVGGSTLAATLEADVNGSTAELAGHARARAGGRRWPLGFLTALREVFTDTREQRCRVHKTADRSTEHSGRTPEAPRPINSVTESDRGRARTR